MSEEIIRHFPDRDTDLVSIEAPVTDVTLLEDRAQVRRAGKVSLKSGQNRLLVDEVAPVIVDVSLVGSVAGSGAVSDIRIRRAMRIRSADKPEEIRTLEEEMHGIERRFLEIAEDRARAEGRCQTLSDMLEKAADEVPDDVAWGIVNHQAWRDAFETLFKRIREQKGNVIDQYHEQCDLASMMSNLTNRRDALERPNMHFIAWIEIDVAAEADGEVDLAIDYVVPNALWRPIHRAHLEGNELSFTTAAAVWQNTGEDWKEASLCFSTARSSLGTDPPLLADDLLTAQKKSEQVRVERREVAIQKASVTTKGRSQASSAIELPGVDDGGEIQNLKVETPCTVPSDGRPNMIPILDFTAEAETTLLAMPELEQKGFLKAVAKNCAPAPILAGPVELIQKNGFVGWTKMLYVATGEKFELSFGPDDAIRISRRELQAHKEKWVDNWRITESIANIWLSNLGDEEKKLIVAERIPISEVEQVKVTLMRDRTTGEPKVDDNGICSWGVTLEPHGHEQLRLTWSLAVAPDVEGI